MQLDLILIPDTHLGQAGREWRYQLLTEVIELATEHQSEICFLGDTMDLSQVCSKNGAYRRIRQHHHLTQALKKYVQAVPPRNNTGTSIHWIRGNHDEVITKEHWQDIWEIPVTTHEGFFIFESHNILVHHGHLITYRKGPQPSDVLGKLETYMKSSEGKNHEKQLAAFNQFFIYDETLTEALEAWDREISLVGMGLMELAHNLGRWIQRIPAGNCDEITSVFLEKWALNKLRRYDQKTLQSLAKLYDQFKNSIGALEKEKLLAQISATKNKLWHHLLRKESLVAEAAAKTLGVRATVSGHTHYPTLHRWPYLDKTNKLQHTIVGNAGSIYTHAYRAGGIGPSYIAIDTTSTMHVLEWQPKPSWKIINSEQLTA